MIKNLLFLFVCIAIIAPFTAADAACTKSSSKYVACKPGYYLSPRVLGGCIKCPSAGLDTAGNTVAGTSADHNTGSITSCRMPQVKYQDDTGLFEIKGVCPYVS